MTRMWMIDPQLLCQQHLLGEHSELHQLAGTIQNHEHADAILDGHTHKETVDDIDTACIRSRHKELVNEMERRGMTHDSPLPLFSNPCVGEIDEEDRRLNILELQDRCSDCFMRITWGLQA